MPKWDNMENKIVIVCGKGVDNYGMPEPFYLYQIVASQRTAGYVAVSKIGYSAGIPVETLGSELIQTGVVRDAIDQVINRLRDHFAGLETREYNAIESGSKR